MADKTIQNARELACACCWEVAANDALIPEAMARLRFDLSDQDRDLAHEIVYGTFRYLPGLERLLDQYVTGKKPPPKLRWLMLTSLYQLAYMRAPTYAIVNEMVDLAKASGFAGLKGLVNGVLRRAGREREQLAAKFSLAQWLLPPWLEKMYREHYGKEVETWLESWTQPAPTCYWSADDQPLEGDQPSDVTPHGFRRRGSIALDDMASHRIYVQNESSQAVAEAVIRSGAVTVLDLCAAPGGKSCYIAAFGNASGLSARDVSAERMSRMTANRERLGLTFEIAQGDAGLEPNSFDLVLADAPCTGLGIIGRHPEIKFLKKQVADEGLRALQAEIMANAWSFVKPGGHLLFTVCSLDRREIPKPPEDAVPDGEALAQWLPQNLPRHAHGARFHVTPNAVFDGFSGVLFKKP